MPYLYLACAFILNGAANILLKLGSIRGLTFEGTLPSLIVLNWQFLVGLVLFALNALFYFLALRTLPLSLAYPVMVVMSFIIINGYALFYIGESITTLQLIGYAVIIGGLLLVFSNA